jgi:hypothetical protein
MSYLDFPFVPEAMGGASHDPRIYPLHSEVRTDGQQAARSQADRLADASAPSAAAGRLPVRTAEAPRCQCRALSGAWLARPLCTAP